MFSNDVLHRRSMIKIPVPYFVTFYNGLEKWIEEEEEIKLSNMYEIPVDNPQLELKVQVININKDVDILSKCETLRGYMTFVNKTRCKTQVEKKDVKQAVLEAIDECMEENILVDFFEKHREEVVEVSIYDYDEEKVRKTLADEAREEGRLEGEIIHIIKKVKKSKPLPTIASELEEEEADIKPLYDAVVASAPDYDIEEIKVKLNI